MKQPEIRTKRWTRSPRGEILGVATGLAEWKGFPEDVTRILMFIAVCCTSFIPGIIVYLIIAVILPVQTEDDIIHSEYYSSSSYNSYKKSKNYEDANFREAPEKTTEELKKEYEELKKKVESMENEMFDREKDWDERFREGTK